MQNTDQIDHRVGRFNQRVELCIIVDIGRDNLDLGQQEQVTPVAPSLGRNHNVVVVAGQSGNKALPDEPGAADDEE